VSKQRGSRRGPRWPWSRDERQPGWRDEFPYRRDQDDAVTRRHFLQLSVITSGALFGGTSVFALLGRLDPRRRGDPEAIIATGDLPEGEAHYFRYPGSGEQAVLLNRPGQGFVAYSQKCTHLACAVYYQPEHDRLYCPCHEGIFDPTTGEVTAGPPQRPLPRIRLEIRGDLIYALEEEP